MTEVHPSGTFYFDKYVSFELIFIWREFRDLRSQRGFLHLCGVCSSSVLGGGLSMDLARTGTAQSEPDAIKFGRLGMMQPSNTLMSPMPMVLSDFDK